MADLPAASAKQPNALWLKAMPALFVLLWSTGFIGAKYGMPYAGPLSFLLVRFTLVTAVLAAVVWLARAPLPADWRAAGHSVVSGLLIHGIYLGAVFWAIAEGMPAGLSALIVGTQPLLTALLVGPLLGEKIGAKQWIGVLLGLIGVALVLAPKAGGAALGGIGPFAFALCLIGLTGITLGTIYQKAFATAMDLRTGALLQYAGATALTVPFVLFVEGFRVEWTLDFLFALAWLAGPLSLGAVTLLMVLIRSGAVASVAALFYLVPSVTAILAFAFFGETLTLIQIAGMALTGFSVWLATKSRLAPL